MESLIAGEELDKACWHPNFLLFHESEPFSDRIHDETGVLARTDFKTHSLRICGSAGVIWYACRLIEDEVKCLRNIATTEPLHLGTVAFFDREGIRRLKELIGKETVTLDLASRHVRSRSREEQRPYITYSISLRNHIPPMKLFQSTWISMKNPCAQSVIHTCRILNASNVDTLCRMSQTSVIISSQFKEVS
jgi:hypothetical protein